MGRYLWNKFCKLLCLIFIVWLICQKLGIDLIDWSGVEDIMIAAAPSVIIFLAIVYVIVSVFKR